LKPKKLLCLEGSKAAVEWLKGKRLEEQNILKSKIILLEKNLSRNGEYREIGRLEGKKERNIIRIRKKKTKLRKIE